MTQYMDKVRMTLEDEQDALVEVQMDIDDVKDEWKSRFDKEKETFAAIALKNKTRLK